MLTSFHIPTTVVIRVSIPKDFQLPEFVGSENRPPFVSDSIKAIFLDMETRYNRWYEILTTWPGAVSENSLEIWASEHEWRQKCAAKLESSTLSTL